VIELPILPLGRARLDDFDWRHGPGRESFLRAISREKARDWPAAAAAAREALAADPGHLDAAWLLATALARQGDTAAMLGPIQTAATGDWAKWGERSLDLPLFADFRTTPAGRAWTRAAVRYREAQADALGRALVVLGRPGVGGPGEVAAERRAELFAVDVEQGRWLRLTRTGGAVAAALEAPGAPLHAFVAYRSVQPGRAGRPTILRDVSVGVVDRSTGKLGRPVDLGDAARVVVAWRTVRGGEPRLELDVAPAEAGDLDRWRVDWRRGSKTRVTERRRGDTVEVTAQGARRTRLPVAGVRADWDDGVASALRIETSHKTIAPPALVDGETVAWAPGGARLAFATAPADPCGAGEARVAQVFGVDAASGRLLALGTGDGPAQLRWLDATRLAHVAGDRVRIVDAARGDELGQVAGGAGVALDALTPLRRCAPVLAEDDGPFAPAADEDWDEEAASPPPSPSPSPSPPPPPSR